MEHITKAEGRGLVWCVARVHRGIANHRTRNSLLVGNMALCLAISRGRSSSASLKLATRQVAARSFACGIKCATRWDPSESNIADGPSRGLSCALGCQTGKPLPLAPKRYIDALPPGLDVPRGARRVSLEWGASKLRR